jgi:hypothetical protein
MKKSCWKEGELWERMENCERGGIMVENEEL